MVSNKANANTIILKAGASVERERGIELFDLLMAPEDGPEVMNQGIVLGAIRKEQREGQGKVLVPVKSREVAWAKEGSGPRSKRLPGQQGVVRVAGAINVHWEPPAAEGKRPTPQLVQQTSDDGSAIALVQLGLVYPRAHQQRLLTNLMGMDQEIFPIGVYDLGGSKEARLVRKIRWGYSHLKADAGVEVTTRANILVHIERGGEALMAGLLKEDGVHRLVNRNGYIEVVDAPTGRGDPRALFEELAYGRPLLDEEVATDAVGGLDIEEASQ
jgi:hypothetical protein